MLEGALPAGTKLNMKIYIFGSERTVTGQIKN